MDNVPASLAAQYDSIRPHLEKLQKFVASRLDTDISGVNKLLVSGRVKKVGSILQKLQTGEYESMYHLRDLAAVTVVTLYRREVQDVIDIVKKSGLTIHDVPPKPVEPTDFRYREPKLYVEPPPEYLDRNPELRGLLCEVQFTTALQNALDLTTHDFDYKGKAYSWTNFRLVAQLRGMLELVDRMIDDIESVAITQSEFIAIPDKVLNAEKILQVITDVFDDDRLPSDRRRLADTVASWLVAAEVEVENFRGVLEASSALCEISSLDVSSIILGALVVSHGESMIANSSQKFVVGDELQTFCPEIKKIPADRRVIWIPEPTS